MLINFLNSSDYKFSFGPRWNCFVYPAYDVLPQYVVRIHIKFLWCKVYIERHLVRASLAFRFSNEQHIRFWITVVPVKFSLKIIHFSFCLQLSQFEKYKKRVLYWDHILTPHTYCKDPIFFVHVLLGQLHQFKTK